MLVTQSKDTILPRAAHRLAIDLRAFEQRDDNQGVLSSPEAPDGRYFISDSLPSNLKELRQDTMRI